MRKHGQSGDHRHQMQEQNDIPQERVRHILTFEDFEVVPHSLVAEPEEHAHAHQDPEESDVGSGAARARGIGQEGRGRNQQQSALDQVAGNGEGVASWYQHRRRRLGENQRDQYRDPEFCRYGQGKLLRPPF